MKRLRKNTELAEQEYYVNMTSTERLNLMQILREEYFKRQYKIRPRFRKVIKINRQKN